MVDFKLSDIKTISLEQAYEIYSKGLSLIIKDAKYIVLGR